MSGSVDVAVETISALRGIGVRDVVLAPGSRSAALAVLLHQADADGLLRLHVRIDERSAGFLALGLAKGGHRPVAIVTTSGTAVANLHPAVLEGVHVGERLVVVTADRPASLRGRGANQTTEQVGLFGPRVPCTDVSPGGSASVRAAIAAAAGRRGPTHVNLQFAEPLLPDALPVPLPAGVVPDVDTWDRPQFRRPDGSVTLERGPRTVVVAGEDAGPPARLLAQGANWPLLAEPTSGSRTGTHAVRTYRLLLGSDLADDIERVVVAGHPTLSRPVMRLISRTDIEVVTLPAAGGTWTDPAGVGRHLPSVPVVDGGDGDDWINRWRAADAAMSNEVDRVAGGELGLPLRVAAEVGAAVCAEGLLVVGSSQPARDLDVMLGPFPAGERRLVLGNRGLAGIDGTVSTAIGAALGRRSARSLAYVGDVTFLHDANGLVMGSREPRPDLTVVVANDDGGAIFSTLEQGDPRYAAAFERVFGTAHGVSIRDLCAATGTPFVRAGEAEELRRVLASEPAGVRVVEVLLDRSRRRELDAELRALA